jgi:tetratricopeptide (TPR) repeat protein
MERAEAEYRGCLKDAPTSPPALAEVSGFFDRRERSDEGTELWRHAAKAEPDNLILILGLVRRLEPEQAQDVLLAAAERIDSPEAWNAVANLYRGVGNAEKAEAALARAIELAEDRPEALLFAQADLLVELRELDQAETIAAGLDETLRSLIQARIYAARGDRERALSSLDDGFVLWPNNPGARFLAGQMALELGDLDRAFAEYRESVRADPQVTDASLVLARLYFLTRDYASAAQFARRHATAHPTDRAQALGIAIQSYAALERYDLARQLTRQLARIEGEQINALVARAEVERSARSAAAAVIVIDESEVDPLDPQNEAVLRQLVDLLVEQGELAAAISRVDAALARTPNAASLHDLRGRTLFAAGRVPEALAEFERALEIDPSYGPAWGGLATLVAAGGQKAEAVELFRRAVAAEPSDSESRYNAAQLLIQLERWSEAETELRQVVQTSPWHLGACNDLAWVLAEEERDLDFALSLAERAVRLRPEPSTLDTLGWVRLARAEPKEAVVAFRQALEDDPDAPEIRQRLDLALEASGDSTL